MTLEQQVCSLALAKRLKELHVEQESLFVYWKPHGMHVPFELAPNSKRSGGYNDYIAAFTVAELGEMLPWNLRKDEQLYFLHLDKNGEQPVIGKQWEVSYDAGSEEDIEPLCYFSEDTETDARAKMLIYLLENNLITL